MGRLYLRAAAATLTILLVANPFSCDKKPAPENFLKTPTAICALGVRNACADESRYAIEKSKRGTTVKFTRALDASKIVLGAIKDMQEKYGIKIKPIYNGGKITGLLIRSEDVSAGQVESIYLAVNALDIKRQQ
ncbi:hypothetical protein KJ780_01685 [Candidatus Micrarchaeota archaeon]|nr:hypothetical protein [Candidatus Micrarchaeota archaeon]